MSSITNFGKSVLRPFAAPITHRLWNRMRSIAREQAQATNHNIDDLRLRFGDFLSIQNEILRTMDEMRLRQLEIEKKAAETKTTYEVFIKSIRQLEQQFEELRIAQYFGRQEMAIASRIVQLRSMRGGSPFSLMGSRDDRSIIGAVEYSDGQYEQHVVAAISESIRTDATCIDIGANIGAVALQLSEIVPNGEVHCFEPSPTNFGFLQKNVQANRLLNVKSWNLGLSNKPQLLSLNYMSGLAACSFVLGDSAESKPQELEGAVQEVINCVRLDDWAEENGLRSLDLIKLDAEGMERAILEGAEKIISRHQPILVMEFNPHTIEDFGHGSAEELYSYLAAHWAAIFLINRSGEKTLIGSYAQLNEIVTNGPGWEDLICFPKS